jgi:hypothetical protein
VCQRYGSPDPDPYQKVRGSCQKRGGGVGREWGGGRGIECGGGRGREGMLEGRGRGGRWGGGGRLGLGRAKRPLGAFQVSVIGGAGFHSVVEK